MAGSPARAVWPERRVVGGRRAPAEHGRALLEGDPLDELLAAATRGRVGGQEHEAGAVARALGQRDAELLALLGEKGVRHLHQDPGAVAGVLLAAAGAAVLEVEQHLDRLLDDRVRLAAVRVDDEPDPARVVLEAGIVETLCARTWGVFHVRPLPSRPPVPATHPWRWLSILDEPNLMKRRLYGLCGRLWALRSRMRTVMEAMRAALASPGTRPDHPESLGPMLGATDAIGTQTRALGCPALRLTAMSGG